MRFSALDTSGLVEVRSGVWKTPEQITDADFRAIQSSGWTLKGHPDDVARAMKYAREVIGASPQMPIVAAAAGPAPIQVTPIQSAKTFKPDQKTILIIGGVAVAVILAISLLRNR